MPSVQALIGAPVQDEATPVPPRAGADGLIGREYDGILSGAHGLNPRAPANDHDAPRGGLAVDPGAGIDLQHGLVRVVTDEHAAAEEPRLVRRKAHALRVLAGQDAGTTLVDAFGVGDGASGVGVGRVAVRGVGIAARVGVAAGVSGVGRVLDVFTRAGDEQEEEREGREEGESHE